MSSPVLTITIESADYLDVDRALRVRREHYVPGMPGGEYVRAIIEARRKLGLSNEKRHILLDYDPEKDEDYRPFCGVFCEPTSP